MRKPRKITKITLCDRHAFHGAGRDARRAAVMGGWAGGPCACRCLPGTDTYLLDLVERFPQGFTFGTV